MGQIVNERSIGQNTNGRVAAAYPDGAVKRYVDVLPDNAIEIRSQEGALLYTERALQQRPGYVARTLDVEVSAVSGLVLLILGGFIVNEGESRRVTIRTDLRAEPELRYGEPGNALDDVPG